MTESYRFYKTSDNQWFIDIPEYPGSIQDLQMVAGADDMLDVVSEGTSEVWLKISDDNVLLENTLDFLYEEKYGGAWYELFEYNKKEIKHRMWLCPVVTFLFLEYPLTIYFEKL